jgi:carbonic anhydrase
LYWAGKRQFVLLNQTRFHLVQFRFHHPSEHQIDGEQQTMELHVVHQNIVDGSQVVIGSLIEATDLAAGVPDLFAHIKDFAATPLNVQTQQRLSIR